MPCEEHRDYFLGLFRDEAQDPELRIASYLEVMKCPTYIVIKTIKHALSSEQVNQVGSFVWSHLENLLHSSIPSRVEIQGLLQDHDLGRKFSRDMRKFSRSFEGSIFLDEYNAGGSVESNVIFSPKSYIPRSAMLNLTLDLFGESINVFEVSARAEGFEHYVESVFGPKKPLNARVVEDRLQSYLRLVRSAGDGDSLPDRVRNISNVVRENRDTPQVKLGFKIFGNEFSYNTFVGMEEIMSALSSVNPVNRIQQILSGKEINFSKAMLLLDTTYVVPTGVGLPVSLNAVGTGAMNVVLSGLLKASDFLTTRHLDIESKIHPSIALDVVGTMSVDAYYASTAIKLKTNLYTSTAVEGQLKVRGARLVSLNFNLPKNKAEIFTAESELIVARGGEEEPQIGITEGRTDAHVCTWTWLDKTLGLQFCGDLQFPNASLNKNASDFILNGPTKFSLSLQKADPTAKKYLLEYKWESNDDATVVSLVFDTPGSSVKREVSARLNLDKDSQNLTLVLNTGKNTYTAVGNYKNEENDRFMAVRIDTNGERSFDALVGLKRTEEKHGSSYFPRLYIVIRNETIVELKGSLQWVRKHGVSQCTVDLQFDTKRVRTQLHGYVQRGDALLSLVAELNYTLHDGQPPERVRLEAGVSRRPSPGREAAADVEGDLQLASSVYPHLNFVSAFKYRQIKGHIDLLAEINAGLQMKDERNKLSLHFVFIEFKAYEGNKISASLQITKPNRNIDIKTSVTYSIIGATVTFEVRVKYAKEKEVITLLRLSFPRSTRFSFQGHLNVTVPLYRPMILNTDITEKEKNDYEVDVFATWFSGSNYTVKGFYQDRSTVKELSHSLKLLASSTTFSDVILIGKLHHSDSEFKLSAEANQNDNKYAVLLKRATISQDEFESYVEVWYKDSVYSATMAVNFFERKQLKVELHLDKYRDIHMQVRALSRPELKVADFELKWDANRDPGQKLSTGIELVVHRHLNYSTSFVVSFPGRSVHGEADVSLTGTQYKSSAHVEWSPQDAVHTETTVLFEREDAILLQVSSHVRTPFEHWKSAKVAGGFLYKGDRVRANGTMEWQEDQRISAGVSGEYSRSETDFRAEFNTSVTSSIPQVTPMSFSFFHKQDADHVDTNLYMQYKSEHTFGARSTWEMAREQTCTNVSGAVLLLTPYAGYRRGSMVCALVVTEDWDMSAGADVNIDRRKYTLSAEGHLKDLSDSMLVFNLTTPIHNYTRVQGRLGYSEARRHLVAEVTSPHEVIGVEVIFDCASFHRFDVKLSFAPALEFLNRTLLVASLNGQKADFRIGFNSLMVGFTGVSRFVSFTDLEYSCKVYTPLLGFEENGVTLRLVYTNKFNVDFECGAHVTDTKLGVKARAADKPRIFRELPRQLTAGALEDRLAAGGDPGGAGGAEGDDDYGDYGEEEEEAVSWAGLLEVDTVLYPTMRAQLDVDEKGSLYVVAGSLTLPDGTAELYDEFSFVDYFDMSNHLELTTPCDCFKEFKEQFKFYLGVGGQMQMLHDFRAKINNHWHKLGLTVNHTYEVLDDAGSVGVRSVVVKLYTPFDAVRKCDLATMMMVNGSRFSGNVTIETANSSFVCNGEFQKLPGYLSGQAELAVDLPVFRILPVRTAVLLDLNSAVKQVEVEAYDVDLEQSLLAVQLSWQRDGDRTLQASGRLAAPSLALPGASGSLTYASAPERGFQHLAARALFRRQEFVLNGSLEGEALVVEVQTPIRKLRNGRLSGTLTSSGAGVSLFRGTYSDVDLQADVSGDIRLVPSKLLQLNFVFVPEMADYDYKIGLLLKKKDRDYVASAALFHPYGITYNASSILTARSATDWTIDADLSLAEGITPKHELISGRGKFAMLSFDNISAEFDAVSGIENFEKVKFVGIHQKTSKTGMMKTLFDVAQHRGEFTGRWSWFFLENMMLNVLTSYRSPSSDRHARAEMFVRNPRKSYEQLTLGYDLSLNRDSWQAGANCSMRLVSSSDVSATVNLKLPPPGPEVHSAHGELRYSKDFSRVFQDAWYRAYNARIKYQLTGEVTNTGRDLDASYAVTWGAKSFRTINNIVNVTQEGDLLDVSYVLRTPNYQEDTFVTKLYHNRQGDKRNIRANVYCPSSNPFLTALVNYKNLGNMDGMVKTNTPVEALSHVGVNFRTLTQLGENQRYAEVFWPNNTALLDSRYTYDKTNTETSIVGSAVVEIPVATRHIARVEYDYKEKPLNTTGHASVEYNGDRFVEAKYRCDSESSAGFEKDVVNVEVENGFTPVGIFYVHQLEYSAGVAGSNLPTTDKKHVEVFKLRDKKSFNLTGELDVRSFLTGKNITIKAFHVNKMAKFSTEYEYLDQEYRQKSRCDLAPHVWASYDLKILNKTKDDRKEEHLELDILYPRRDFNIKGYYQLTKYLFSSEVSLAWDKLVRTKSLGASLDWKRLSDGQNRQHAVVSIKHPSFKKDVTLNAQYVRNSRSVVDLSSNLIYSSDDRKNFVLTGSVQDNSVPPLRKYDLAIVGSHPETHLDMKLKSAAQWDGHVYKAHGTAHYKRTYLPLQKGEFLLLLDKLEKEFEFEKKTLRELSFLRAKFEPDHPVYTLTGALKNGTSTLDANALFYIDLREKLVEGTVNYTPEATENFQMYGKIPDSRNAAFNAWRNYEDASISDASFYLRLNHSHLVTSKMVWRPEITSELKSLVEEWLSAIVTSVVESVNYWKVYVRSETKEAINDIWLDAKSEMQPFLDDISELHVLVDDLEDFKKFLNESYYANDFYIQDVVKVLNFLVDEFSLRGHVDSVPRIVNEIWAVMGESGEAAHRSVTWIIETIKDTYKKVVDFVKSFLKGDSTEYVSAILDDVVEKYDKFVKDIHLSFVKQLEDFWSTMSKALQEHWNTFLETVEPTFIHAIHYLEALAWNASKEITAFLYERKLDIVDSYYYNQFANLTQDIDRIYRDINKNDIITNIRKYSKLIFEFVKEKYFSLVPFGKELEEILSEIIGEFRELGKLPSVHYAIETYNTLYAKVAWVYEYLDVGGRLQYAVALLHSKLTDMTQTALQAESRYREAKTKFIFDPENGRVELEQKLPMSWHAFNETPKFEEIPEYKMITSIPTFLAFSNVTFWSLYYEYKPFTDPTNWLPPFRAQAMLAGPQNFVTFDKRFFQFRGSCAYLLANDFVDYNFSLVVSYDGQGSDEYEIALVVGKDIVLINLFRDSVVVQKEGVKKLPAQLKDTYVYQEAEMVYIENSNGFTIQCNMKFDVCTVVLEGWYFGKTAGLLGTMNNEPGDDALASSGAPEPDLGRLARSWSVGPAACASDRNLAAVPRAPVDPTVADVCRALFQSKASDFATCFPVLDPAPFLHMCLSSRDAEMRDPCTAAMAYMQACLMENTPLRIPDVCVRCRDAAGRELVEGNFQKLEGERVPRSGDVVFLLEGKACNRDVRARRNLDVLLAAVGKELAAAGLVDNRYGLVVFGGEGVYDQPRSVVVGNKVFATLEQFGQYFDNIPVGMGSNDTFGAIRYAARLMFRPGVSKTFVLLPCSNCDSANMTLDYTVLHQVLLESDITLHIIMSGIFKLDKAKFNKAFYGIDTNTAFTKNDVKQLKGSVELRRQVKMPKSQIGLCAPLALETNGTIFSVRKLEAAKKKAAKKMATVFARRLALTAGPGDCQTCECTADNNGMSFMECFPCHVPAPSSVDYEEFITDDEDLETFLYDDAEEEK
ncbi:uncharacterized protein LOC134540049 isoform X2 [Bacillus rossius redtenbacheri]|uniref:uncharacterized protein LOC134540049 isoform X2 n=1 Tax=Bacillus rossius redtenbacheri TaxID=93214 RepID=UPI002FDD0F14